MYTILQNNKYVHLLLPIKGAVKNIKLPIKTQEQNRLDFHYWLFPVQSLAY